LSSSNKKKIDGAPFQNINDESSHKENIKNDDIKETFKNNNNKISPKKYLSWGWWILFPIISILFIVILLLFILYLSLFDCQQVGYTINQSQSIMSLVPIDLDRSKYSIGQIVHINLTLKNNYDSQFEETYLEINRTHFPSAIPGCYNPFKLSDQDTFALIKLDPAKYNYTFIPNQPGLYVISTFNSSQHKEFKTIFEVINPIKSTTFVMLIIAIGFFIALVLLCYILSIKSKDLNNDKISKIKEKNGSSDEIIEEENQKKILDYIEIASSVRFLFISALVWSIVFAFVFTEVEIGTQSPFGLVLRHNLNPYGGELDVHGKPLIDWGINIGGSWENNFSSGLIIPVYVFILGLIGGYLRYLTKAMSKEINIQSKQEPESKTNSSEKTNIIQRVTKIEREKTSLEFAENTYGELSNIFLAPLLAAVVWFVLSQGQTTFNIYSMAAVSFSIGLITREIIQIIVKFMEKVISP
jgi:hypothetical protein